MYSVFDFIFIIWNVSKLYKFKINFCNYKISAYIRIMLQFIEYQKDDGEVIVINPVYVAHIYQSPKELTVILTMCDGRRYEIERDYTKNITALGLASTFEKKANYGGC